jgi:hypothetical protein
VRAALDDGIEKRLEALAGDGTEELLNKSMWKDENNSSTN